LVNRAFFLGDIRISE